MGGGYGGYSGYGKGGYSGYEKGGYSGYGNMGYSGYGKMGYSGYGKSKHGFLSWHKDIPVHRQQIQLTSFWKDNTNR
jgi:hypothetical protein